MSNWRSWKFSPPASGVVDQRASASQLAAGASARNGSSNQLSRSGLMARQKARAPARSCDWLASQVMTASAPSTSRMAVRLRTSRSWPKPVLSLNMRCASACRAATKRSGSSRLNRHRGGVALRQQAVQRPAGPARGQVPHRDVQAGNDLRDRPTSSVCSTSTSSDFVTRSKKSAGPSKVCPTKRSPMSTTSRARCSAPTAGQLAQTSPWPWWPCASVTHTSTKGQSRKVPKVTLMGIFTGTRKQKTSIEAIRIGSVMATSRRGDRKRRRERRRGRARSGAPARPRRRHQAPGARQPAAARRALRRPSSGWWW